MSKILTRKQILNYSPKPLIIRSKVYGKIKFRGFLSLNDLIQISKFMQDQLDDKQFTISVITAQVIVKEGVSSQDVNSWDDKKLLFIARKLGEKLFEKDLVGQKIKSYSDFKTIAIKHADDFNKRMGVSIKGIGESAIRALKIYKQIENMTSALVNKVSLDMRIATSGITSALANSIKAFDTAQAVHTALISSLPKLDAVFAYIEKSKKETDEILNLIEESEYELAIDLLKDKFSRGILKTKFSKRKSIITKKLVQITGSFEFNENLEKLFEPTYLKPRWIPLKQALLAHQSRQYYLSVPVFVAQAEGVFTDLLVLRRLAYRKEKKYYALEDGLPKKNTKGKLIKLDTLSQKASHAKGHFEDEKYIELTVDAIVSRFIEIRNGVFHGRINNYGTAANSTKSLLLVFTLAGLLEREIKK